MKKKNPIIAIFLTLIFAMAPFGAVANALTWNQIETEITNLRSNPVAVSQYAVASATDQDVAQAIKRPPGEFNNMRETEMDADGSFTGITWVTRSRLAAAAKYRTQVIIRQGESR